MELKNFRQANANSAKPAGPCELGGVPAHCFFDRSGVGLAWITIRASMEHGAPLPAALAGVRTLTVLGKSVPVSVVKLDCGAQALRGSVDPELIQAVLDAAGKPGAPEADAGAGADADPGSGPAQDQGPKQDQAQSQAGGPEAGPTPAAPPAAPAPAGVTALIEKLKNVERIESDIRKAEENVVRLTRLERKLAADHRDSREDLESAKILLAGLKTDMAVAGRKIRAILDREGI